jgi:signal peptidase I
MIKSQKIKKARKQGTEWLKAVLYALLITWLIRLLVLQGFFIPSASMEQTLLTGDFLFINKLAYGPRFPITPLSLPFVHQHLPFTESTPSYFDWIQLPYLRLPGYSSIKQNDIVVFNYPLESEFPIDKRTYFIKRCIGLPGDTIEIENQKVKVNSELLP